MTNFSKLKKLIRETENKPKEEQNNFYKSLYFIAKEEMNIKQTTINTWR